MDSDEMKHFAGLIVSRQTCSYYTCASHAYDSNKGYLAKCLEARLIIFFLQLKVCSLDSKAISMWEFHTPGCSIIAQPVHT